MIPPFDHPDVIAGQGTCGLEILEQRPDVDTVLVPVSGGGLLAGICIAVAAAQAVRPGSSAVEPAGAAKLTAALAAGGAHHAGADREHRRRPADPVDRTADLPYHSAVVREAVAGDRGRDRRRRALSPHEAETPGRAVRRGDDRGAPRRPGARSTDRRWRS